MEERRIPVIRVIRGHFFHSLSEVEIRSVRDGESGEFQVQQANREWRGRDGQNAVAFYRGGIRPKSDLVQLERVMELEPRLQRRSEGLLGPSGQARL